MVTCFKFKYPESRANDKNDIDLDEDGDLVLTRKSNIKEQVIQIGELNIK